MENLNYRNKSSMLMVRNRKGLTKVSMAKILYVECIGFYCILVLVDGKRLDYSCSLMQMEEKLHNLRFSKIGRNHLVNLDYVSMVKRYNSRKWSVMMADQTELPIAYRRLVEFKKAYLNGIMEVKDVALN